MPLFPTNPTDGQQVEASNQIYVYDSAVSAWRKSGSSSDARSIASTSDLRIELSSTLYDQTRVLSSSQLYLHNLVGSTGRIGLYNSTKRRWELRPLPSTPLGLTLGTIVPNRVHDVYIFDTTPNNALSSFQIELLAWQDNTIPPAREYKDGVPVRTLFNERRLIGTILTSPTTQSEVINRRGNAITKLNAIENYPRMGFSNLYNSIRTEYKLSLSDSFGRNTNGDWETPNGYNDQAVFVALNASRIDGIIKANVASASTAEHKFGISSSNSTTAITPYSDTLVRLASFTGQPWIDTGSVSIIADSVSSGVGSRTYAYLYSQTGAGSENAVFPGAGFSFFVNQ